MQFRSKIALFVLLFLQFAVAPAFAASAACYVINPANAYNGNGLNWNAAASNGAAGAFNAIPATLTRGAIYYLADGTYPAFTFSQADSGTTPIEFRKAKATDNCNLTGWNTSTMGSSQAVFTRDIGAYSDYVIFNGNGTQTAQGCGGAPGSTVTSSPPNPADCGIKIDNTGCTVGNCNDPIYIGNPNTSSAVNYVTFEYVELVGNGSNTTDQFEVFGPYGSTGDMFNHVYMHNAGCVYFQDGLNSHTTTNSYFWGTEVNGAGGGCHGQYLFSSGSDSNSIESGNVYRDITGTAIWTFANYSTTHDSWLFYNNVIFNSSPAASWAPYLSDGTIACINAGTNCANFSFLQNTVININVPGINNENTGSYTVQNNLYYGLNPPSFNPGTGGTYTQDHNSCLNSGTCPSGTSNITDTAAPNPFVNWTAGNFNLASENADWKNRMSLGSIYITDPNATTRATDRGAYQYVTSPTAVPQPQPTPNVVITPQ
jgi:hypothetical protein